MKQTEKHPHFIRAWRRHKKLSLRKLAARIENVPGEELISYASLNRIENGLQPYNEFILNGIAEALNVEPWMLLRVDPTKNGEVIDLMVHLTPDQQKKAIKMIEILKSA